MKLKLTISSLNPKLLLNLDNTADAFTPIASFESTEIVAEIVKRVNIHAEVMDALLALVRESKSNTEAVKKAVELLNRNKE